MFHVLRHKVKLPVFPKLAKESFVLFAWLKG